MYGVVKVTELGGITETGSWASPDVLCTKVVELDGITVGPEKPFEATLDTVSRTLVVVVVGALADGIWAETPLCWVYTRLVDVGVSRSDWLATGVFADEVTRRGG